MTPKRSHSAFNLVKAETISCSPDNTLRRKRTRGKYPRQQVQAVDAGGVLTIRYVMGRFFPERIHVRALLACNAVTARGKKVRGLATAGAQSSRGHIPQNGGSRHFTTTP